MDLHQSHFQRLFDPRAFPVIVDKEPLAAGVIPQLNYHPEVEIQLCRLGRCEYLIKGVNYRFEQNTLLIIHKNELHLCIPNPHHSVKKTTLIFSPQLMNDRPTGLAALGGLESLHSLILSGGEAAKADFFMNEIKQELDLNGTDSQALVTSYVEALLVHLRRNAESQLIPPAQADPVMQEIIAYLDSNLAKRPTLVAVADLFSMSPYTLCKKFKTYAGLGFREYQIQRRVAEARTLLETTDLKVAGVAYEVGFETLSTFNNDFRRLTGLTPSDFRRISSERNAG